MALQYYKTGAMAKEGIAVGAAKGHIVTKKEKTQRPANRKGVSDIRAAIRKISPSMVFISSERDFSMRMLMILKYIVVHKEYRSLQMTVAVHNTSLRLQTCLVAFFLSLIVDAPSTNNSEMSMQKLSKRVGFIRGIIREVAGQAPYEKRVMELLKVGKDKRALKLCKRKVRAVVFAL